MPGETFQRIWHGDSREKLLKVPDNKVKCILTDPPFGVDNKSKSAVTVEGKKWARKIANDKSPEEAIATFQGVMAVALPKLTEEADVYVFTSYQVLSEWLVMADALFKPWELKRQALLVWEKNGPGQGDVTSNPWGMGMEFIMFYRRGRPPLRGPGRRNSVLHHQQIHPSKLIHPHEKPLPLLVDLIKPSTDEGDFLLDPFGGSGSLARACKQVNRSALCIEYDLENYQIAKQAYDSIGEDLF